MATDFTQLPDDGDVPKANQSWTVYRDYLKGLIQHDNFFERGKGFLSWLQGTVLTLCVESKKLKRGEYSMLLAAIKMKRGTAYNCRRIAKAFMPDRARTLGYTAMLRALGLATLDDRHDLAHEAPEFIDDDGDGNSTPEDQEIGANGKKKTKKISKVTHANVGAVLSKMKDAAKSIKKMPTPKIELDEALKVYQQIRTDAEMIRGFLGQIIANADKKIATIKPGKTKAA